jgi:hypothetical protein
MLGGLGFHTRHPYYVYANVPQSENLEIQNSGLQPLK